MSASTQHTKSHCIELKHFQVAPATMGDAPARSGSATSFATWSTIPTMLDVRTTERSAATLNELPLPVLEVCVSSSQRPDGSHRNSLDPALPSTAHCLQNQKSIVISVPTRNMSMVSYCSQPPCPAIAPSIPNLPWSPTHCRVHPPCCTALSQRTPRPAGLQGYATHC